MASSKLSSVHASELSEILSLCPLPLLAELYCKVKGVVRTTKKDQKELAHAILKNITSPTDLLSRQIFPVDVLREYIKNSHLHIDVKKKKAEIVEDLICNWNDKKTIKEEPGNGSSTSVEYNASVKEGKLEKRKKKAKSGTKKADPSFDINECTNKLESVEKAMESVNKEKPHYAMKKEQAEKELSHAKRNFEKASQDLQDIEKKEALLQTEKKALEKKKDEAESKKHKREEEKVQKQEKKRKGEEATLLIPVGTFMAATDRVANPPKSKDWVKKSVLGIFFPAEQHSIMCPVCGQHEITKANCQIAHIVSEKRGGKFEARNLVPTDICNQEYGTTNMFDYMGMAPHLRSHNLKKVGKTMYKFFTPPEERERNYGFGMALAYWIKREYKLEHMTEYEEWLRLTDQDWKELKG